MYSNRREIPRRRKKAFFLSDRKKTEKTCSSFLSKTKSFGQKKLRHSSSKNSFRESKSRSAPFLTAKILFIRSTSISNISECFRETSAHSRARWERSCSGASRTAFLSRH